jgi:outer membrane protein assembly complex protein YaeT
MRAKRWLIWGIFWLDLGWPGGVLALVVEKEGIQIEIQGASEADAKQLKELVIDQLTLSGVGQPGEPLADDLAFFVRQHFVGKGYSEVQVRWEIVPRGVKLTMDLGEPKRLGQVAWEGDLVLEEAELLAFFLAPTFEKAGGDKREPVWVEREIQAGVVRVQRRLRTEGYLLAEVALRQELGPDPLRQDVVLVVRSGPRFVFGKLRIQGQPDELDELMQGLLQEAAAASFSEAMVQQLERRVVSVATERGWLQAQVTADYTLDPAGGEVDVVLAMHAGERSVIHRITTDARLSKGARRILEASFSDKVGQPYSAEELEQAFRRALDTNVFARLEDSVKPMIEPGDGAFSMAELFLSGEETKPKTVGFEIGLDTFLGLQLGMTFRNTNLWNTGNSLAAEVNYSLAGPTGFVSLTDPAWLGSPYSVSLRLSGESFALYEYERFTLALGLELTRRVNRHFRYSAFTEWSVNAVKSDLPTAWIGPDSYGYLNSGLMIELDFRDSPVLPKKGWLINAQVAYNHDVLGEAASFTRSELRGVFLQPLSNKWRVAVGASGEVIDGAGLEVVPIDSRVFNGGPNSVRGFAMRELGPVTQGGTPLGGTAAVFASAELSYEWFQNFEVAVFGDVGSIGREQVDRPFEFSTDFRPSVGAGLRYLLPFGPLRLDYGYNLDRREGERVGMLHLTAGFAF